VVCRANTEADRAYIGWIGSADEEPKASPTSTGAASAAVYWPHPAAMCRGGSYHWLRALDEAPIPEVPAALRGLLDPEPPTTTRPTDPTGLADPDRPAAFGLPYGRRVLADELAALGRATPGHRNRLSRYAPKVSGT
jgi:hypothetical protein